MKNVFAIVVFSILLLAISALAQTPDDSTKEDSPTQIDTLLYNQSGEFSRVKPVTDSVNYETRLRQAPTLALFKSMLIPGLGQLGNRSYFKALIFAGIDAWFVSSILKYRKNASNYRKLFEAETDVSLRDDYYQLFDKERDQRNKYTWYAVITAFVAMFDAYVDAHFSGYPSVNEHDKIGLQVRPDENGTVITSLYLNF